MTKAVNLSRFVSTHLRHNPEGAFAMDAAGWVSVEKLMALAVERRLASGLQDVHLLFAGERQRYQLSEDGRFIRACSGHSVPVDLDLAPYEPAGPLYFGTTREHVAELLRDGLLVGAAAPGARGTLIRLVADAAFAQRIAERRGGDGPAVIRVDAPAMAQDGTRFFQAPNGEVLTDSVNPGYLELLTPEPGLQPTR